MCVYLLAKFEVSSTTLTSFRQVGEVILPPHISKRTPRLGLKMCPTKDWDV